jgi:glycolate oxidase FAD binding subunit
MTEITPVTLEELREVVCSTRQVLAVGGRTKPRLACAPDAVMLSMRSLSGILEYDPSEFTFTALAGTPLRLIAAALSERGQYLPFDPLLVDAGATLGGAVASGLSGPGRFRYGGLRDFILGVRFVDGLGRLLRMGGKVVKNAAGFDLPKFFVGSLGRFGVLAELTFKVFPRASSFVTVRLPYLSGREAAEIIVTAAGSRWEIDALDASPQESAVYARIGGPAPAADALAMELLSRFPNGSLLSVEEASRFWTEVREFAWAHARGVLVKVPLTPKLLPDFYELLSGLEGARAHVSGGGSVGFLSLPDWIPRLHDRLNERGLRAMTLRGDAPLWLGSVQTPQINAAVKFALDPASRFPALNS